MNQFELILQALDIAIDSKLWEGKKCSDVFRILMYVQRKGWLYTPVIDNRVTAVICAYRIPEVNPDNLTKLPKEDSGDILYIPFVMALGENVNLFHIIRESCKIYLENNPDIKEIVLEDKNNKIKRYKLETLQGV